VGKCAADIGAGTGKFTRLLAQTGAGILAVEPVEPMRAAIGGMPGVHAVAGTAQAVPAGDRSLDAVICAQSFHWFASRAVLDEFARVLQPGGQLGLAWNVRDDSVDWVRQITELITPFEGDAPRFYKGDWRKPFPHPALTELEETAFPHEHVGPPDEVILDRFMSVSFIAALAEPAKSQARAQLQELTATHPDLRGRDVVLFPYRTLAYHCTRLA